MTTTLPTICPVCNGRLVYKTYLYGFELYCWKTNKCGWRYEV